VNIDVAKQERNIYFILFYFSQHCNKIKINAKKTFILFHVKCADGIRQTLTTH